MTIRDLNTIGSKIKKLREIKGFKQDYMAQQLDISQQYYSNIENGKNDIPLSKLGKIADILEIKLEDLISFDEKYILNSYGEKGQQIIHNGLPNDLKQLYEDKIQLLEDKVKLLEEKITSLQSYLNK